MLLACYSHKHISYRIRTIIRKAIQHKASVTFLFVILKLQLLRYLKKSGHKPT
ncbi:MULTISPECIES: hypothetical protein [unclassified Wolbachia]